jgi:hypothetical protein
LPVRSNPCPARAGGDCETPGNTGISAAIVVARGLQCHGQVTATSSLLEIFVTSVASHSVSSVRPDIATHKTHKEQPSDGSFEAMLDSALPDPGNERRGDDDARKSASNASAPSASAPSDASVSGDTPAKKSENTGSDSRDGKPASTKAADSKPAGSKPAKAPDDDGLACESEHDFALAKDAVDAATDDAADALVTPELALATAPAPDATASTPTLGGNPPAVVVPVPTDIAISTTSPATTDATDIAAKPATIPTSGTVTTPGVAPTDPASGTNANTPTTPAGAKETPGIGKQAAAPGASAPSDQAAPVQANADTSVATADAAVDTTAGPAIPANPASAKAPDGSPNSTAPVSAVAANNPTVPHDATRAAPAAAEATETVTQATAPETSDDTVKDAKGSENGRPEDVHKGRGPEGAERKPEPDERVARGTPGRPATPGSEQGIASRSARATEVLAEKAPQAPGGNSNAGSETKGAETKSGHAHAIHTVELAGAQRSATDAPSVTSATTPTDATLLDSTRASAAAPQPLAAGPVTNSGTNTPNAPYAAAALAPVPVSGLAVEIAAQARDGKSRFEIRLDPPELGRIDVHLHVDRDGTVTSRLVVERSETLDLLKRDAPTLERALQNAGLKTGDQGLEFSLRDHGAGRHQEDGQTARGSRVIFRTTCSRSASPATPTDAASVSAAASTSASRRFPWPLRQPSPRPPPPPATPRPPPLRRWARTASRRTSPPSCSC